MKFLNLTTCYGDYLKKFYANRPEMLNATYDKQLEELNYDGFGWADFYTVALAKLGYQTSRIIANGYTIQKTWIKENGIEVNTEQPRWELKVAAEQVIRNQPDIIFVGDHFFFDNAWLNELRKRCPSIRLIIGWCGTPYRDAELFKAFDITLSCIPELVQHFTKLGHESYHLHHSFDPRILQRSSKKQERTIEFSFIGSIVQEVGFHNKRREILEEISNAIDVQIFTPSNVEGVLKPLCFPPVFGLDMFQTLQDSAVTLNNHIDISENSASNMRLWEATGMGTCLLTDWKPDLKNYFDVDNEVVTYKSTSECVEKVKWLAEHPEERVKIAVAGQKRCLKEHTIDNRALQLDEHIKKFFKT